MKYCYEEGRKRTGHVFMSEEITRSARIETLRDTLLEAVPQISADRAMIVTEAYQKYNRLSILSVQKHLQRFWRNCQLRFLTVN